MLDFDIPRSKSLDVKVQFLKKPPEKNMELMGKNVLPENIMNCFTIHDIISSYLYKVVRNMLWEDIVRKASREELL